MGARRWIITIVAAATLLGLAFVHLDRYPRLFFDEGTYLQVERNIAEHGLYAESSSEGPRYYGGVGAGPTVHLPAALSLRLLGAGIWQPRAVVALYLIACVLVFHALARTLGGPSLAWMATALLLVSPALSLVPLGRQVMGEVPGLFFALSALLLWFRRWERHTPASLIGVGVLFGLAAVSKQQFTLVIDVSLAACAALNLVYYRLVPQRTFVVPLLVAVACHLGWSAFFLFLIAGDQRASIFENGRAVAAVSTLVLPPLSMAAVGLRHLLRLGSHFGLLFPALALAVYAARRRSPREQQWSIVTTLALVNFSWYLLLTVGWIRYAFLGLALSSLLVARLVETASDGFRLPARAEWTRLRPALRGAFLLFVAVGVVVAAARLGAAILDPPADDASAMAAYLRQHVREDVLIETWEPEMGFLSDHRFHFPPTRLIADAIAHIHFGGPPPFTLYDPWRDGDPPYILAGEFSVFTDAYDFAEVQRRYRRIKEIGAYQLYERMNPS